MTNTDVPFPDSQTPHSPHTELQRPVSLAQICAPGTAREVIATAEECEAVAARLLIPAVATLSCRFQLTLAQEGMVLAQGALVARITQICVVTLEPFDAELREDFRIRFVPAGQLNDSEDDLLDLDSDDEVPYQGIHIDLGEATVVQLALALDPYPRQPGAVLPAATEDDDAGQSSPFAALARRARQG